MTIQHQLPETSRSVLPAALAISLVLCSLPTASARPARLQPRANPAGVTPVASTPRQVAKHNGPNDNALDQTVAWLKQRLTGLGTLSLPVGSTISMDVTYDDVLVEGEALTIVSHTVIAMTDSKGGPAPLRQRVVIPLADVDPAHVSVVQPKPNEQSFRVDISVAGGRRTIHVLTEQKVGGSDQHQDEAVDTTWLYFRDRDSAERVAKAMVHLATLGGA
jgi:hypothetical protein